VATIREFWESLQANEPPPLDDSTATYQTVRKEHPDIAAGTSVQIDPVLAAAYLDALAAEKAAETELRSTKTELLAVMGDTETALVGDLRVAKRSRHASGSVALNAARKLTGHDIRNLAAQPLGETA
jgi:hypothetical protein